MTANIETDDIADVLIIGYGPAGVTAANLLGQRGWRVTVIDAATAIYDKPRAITADQEAARILQEIGLADEVMSTTTPHPGTDFVGVDGGVIKRFYPAPPPDMLGWTPNWMFVQPELEAILRRGVQRYDNVRVLLGHAFVGMTEAKDSVAVQVCRVVDDQRLTLRARWVIAADGASSSVRKLLRASIEDLAFDEWWIVVDAWIRGPIELPSRCVQYCRPSRPGTYIVGPGTLRRWEIKMMPGETPETFSRHAAVWRVLGEFASTESLEHCRTAIYRFHALVVDEWRHGRVFLMGDAAHQMPPFLGQGLCAGLRDAYNLAWKLDAVLHGQASTSLLDTYGPERKRHVRTVVGHAKSFGLIIGELDRRAALERDQRLRAELESGRASTVRQAFIPGLEDGLIARGTNGAPAPAAGELFVQPWVRDTPAAAWQRLDDMVGARFVIATTHAFVLESLDVDSHTRWRDLEGTMIALSGTSDMSGSYRVVEEREPLLSDWLLAHSAVAVLARPDRYVYGIARSPDELVRMIADLHSSVLPPDATTRRHAPPVCVG